MKPKTIGINGNYLGPTIILNKGDSVLLSVYNDMDESTTMHLHGLHVPPKSDGSPHNVILAHTLWTPRIKISDQASTYWYHNHLHGGETVPESKWHSHLHIHNPVTYEHPHDPDLHNRLGHE